jgi:hypothetical protein
MASTTLPPLPTNSHDEFIQYLSKNPTTPMTKLLEPYKVYDVKIRELFAQDPRNPILSEPLVNAVPVFGGGHASDVRVRARDLKLESQEEQERYIMPLKDADRKANGSPAGILNQRN